MRERTDERGAWPADFVTGVVDAIYRGTVGDVEITWREGKDIADALTPAIFEAELRRRVAALDYAALADLAASLQYADAPMMRRALTTALGVEARDA